MFPQASGMYFKDINNARTLVVKKGDSYTAPVDGWRAETRKYYMLKKTGILKAYYNMVVLTWLLRY